MIGVLFRNEFRMVLRDKRSVLASIVLPLLLMPIMLFGSNWMMKKREGKLRESWFQYAVTGSQADVARHWIRLTHSRVQSEGATVRGQPFRFEEVTTTNAFAALTNRDVHLVIEGVSATEAAISQTIGRQAAYRTLDSGAPVLRLWYRADRDDGNAAVHRMENELLQTRSAQRTNLLAQLGMPVPPGGFLPVKAINTAEPRLGAGLTLGRMIPAMLLFFMMLAGATVATDLVAGEKERGTLETLLTTGANRLQIVIAKHLVILSLAIGITVIQSANLLLYVGFKVIPLPEGWASVVTPAVVLSLLVLFLPVAALIAGVLLLTSGYAKTYKEAQLYFTPVFLLMLLPGLAPMLPELPLRSAVLLVPVANIAIGVREVLMGVYDWPLLGAAWMITAGTAGWILRLTVRVLGAERLVTGAETTEPEFTGGPGLFPDRVVRWFLVLWAALLIVGNYTAGWDLRLQVTLNILVLFLGASLWMVRRYRLNPREAFALRRPKPAVWPAVLMAAPCGMLAGTGVFRLADKFFPVSPEILEGFSQSLLSGSIPVWQTLFFLAVVPGIVEELTFRGILLHGLSRKLRPIPLAIVVGLTFGLFHGALFRLAPTGFLGILLTAVTLLTGSIFPAMLWHILNNFMGVMAGLFALPLSELSAGWYWFGAAGLSAAFWILWRNRTPYPGLKTKARPRGGGQAR